MTTFRSAWSHARLGLWISLWVGLWTTVLGLVAWAERPRRRDDRGDVPGWVLVTIMSAGLVMVIWRVAKSQLTDMLSSALSSVKM